MPFPGARGTLLVVSLGAFGVLELKLQALADREAVTLILSSSEHTPSSCKSGKRKH